MIKKQGTQIKFELLSEESFQKRKEKHKEVREKSKKIRESLREADCELDLTKLNEK